MKCRPRGYSRNPSYRLTTTASGKPTTFLRPPPTTQASRKISWPWVIAGGLASLVVAAGSIWTGYHSNPILSILALDVSDSSLANSKFIEEICRAQTKALKPGDQVFDLVYADTTEPTFAQFVNSPTRSFSRCKSYVSSRPDTVGQGWGTSLIVLLERAYTQVRIQHQQGNAKPVAIIIWLDAAEPGPGLPPLDFSALSQKVEQFNKLQAQIAIIGPTGNLREELERLSLANPNLRVCGLPDAQECIRSTFTATRSR